MTTRSSADAELVEDVAEQVVGHRPGRLVALEGELDGVHLDAADEDRQDPVVAAELAEHHPGHADLAVDVGLDELHLDHGASPYPLPERVPDRCGPPRGAQRSSVRDRTAWRSRARAQLLAEVGELARAGARPRAGTSGSRWRVRRQRRAARRRRPRARRPP